MTGKVTIRAGFIPLLDVSILVAAAECGFAADQGVDLVLVRDTSWANIRDRLAIGHFDVAHMLAPLPVAAALGLTPLSAPLIAPLALGLGGNAITVSTALWRSMVDAGAPANGDPVQVGAALRKVVEARAAAGEPQLTFAVVHGFSGHNYELRYWLAAAGVDPESDIKVAVVPPPFMVDALAVGRIDGYCVGEPWNTAAVAADVGRIVTTKAAIWRLSPEKVLGVRAEWATRNRDALKRLIIACHHASLWCDDPANRFELARILSGPQYLGLPEAILLTGLSNRIAFGERAAQPVPDFLAFGRGAATFPWVSHALWFYSQMVRWGQASLSDQAIATARRAFRPDIYRDALANLRLPLPQANSKAEGVGRQAPPSGFSAGRVTLELGGFFDGLPFDPDHLRDYLASLPFGARPATVEGTR